MNIGIKIVERKPIVEGSPRIICGNSGDTITFTFDSEWSNYTTKVARFVYVKNGVVEPREVLFNGNVAEIPVLSNITEVFIGVYAGELRTTTPVTIPCDFSILCKGGEPVDPTPDIYAQILDALNAKLILEGNASSATKLETPRTIQVDLSNSNGASFDGTTDVTPGVKGVLPKEYGGTGTPTPELIFAPHGVKRVSGSAVAIEDSNESPLANLKLYGKTTQDGTPTPDNPIELKSVGDSGNFSVNVLALALEQGSLSSGSDLYFETSKIDSQTRFRTKNLISVPVGTKINLPVGDGYSVMCFQYTSTGLYVTHTTWQNNSLSITTSYPQIALLIAKSDDSIISVDDLKNTKLAITDDVSVWQTLTNTDTLRGIGDIADEKDFARGVKIQRFGFEKISNYASNNSGNLDNGNAYIFVTVPNKIKARTPTVRCTHAKYDASSLADGTFFQNIGNFVLVGNSTDTYETLIAKYGEGYLLYELETPIETPISETELNAYRQLHTNKPNTTIVSGADLEVDYYTNTLSGETLGNLHSSLYSEIETLKQAIVSLGGEV